MSAIYGIVDLNRKRLESSVKEKMQQRYRDYKIDRYESILEDNVLMGCGIQYITKEAEHEHLPRKSDDNTLYLTADCIIDNRKELLKLLELEEGASDGDIVFAAYNKWDIKCTDYLIGNYAFVVYNTNAEEVLLFSDHVGSRCLFYYINNNKIYFSTLIRPILDACSNNIPFHDKWLLDSATSISPVMYINPEETAFQQVLKVVAGHYVKITLNKVEKIQYWDPVKTSKEWKNVSDEECRAIFLKTLSEVISDYIRTDGQVGILLSSGLDSSAIACTAAPLLLQQGKQLYSFTSVPEADYVSEFSKYYIVNERNKVLEICNQYTNIIPYFEAYEKKTLFSEAEELVDYLELPTKSQNNAVWINEILKKVSARKCRVLLDGQTGNATVSSGDIEEYTYYLISHMRFKKLYEELKLYSKTIKLSRKWFAKYIIKNSIGSTWDNVYGFRKQNVYDNTCINQELANYHLTGDRLKKKHHNIKFRTVASRKQIRQGMFSVNAFSQIGEIKTKTGLKYGLITRDPFMDKRIIELCLHLPYYCFVSEGFERRLIRKYMQGIIPSTVLEDATHRGLQAADAGYRLKKYMGKYEEKINKVFHNEKLRKYVDLEKLEEYYKSEIQEYKGEYTIKMQHLVNLYTFSIFLSSFSVK